ncbi:MAG TPA: class I SAM-dependent methyltransferase [Chloroflexi bacterium]|nr:class I SAM-dependent methyltransferase [Chloroflexota bacterium]
MEKGNRLEGEFYTYLNQMGHVDREWNENVLAYYVPFFSRCGRVLDIGCGEGQFLELLGAEGIDAQGLDIDPGMVERCRQKGLDVVEADLFDYLPRHRETFDGIFCSNLIEHLSAEEAVQFVRLAFDALQEGGVFLIATPNPASLIVHLHEFWRDATHVRPYARHLLEFLLFQAGFREITSGENPRTVWTPSPELQAVPSVLKDLLPRSLDEWRTLMRAEAPLPSPRSFWRRPIVRLRRRAARFLVRTVMFEEFAALNHALSALLSNVQQIERALYSAWANLLLIPREIFAKGIKPSGDEANGAR